MINPELRKLRFCLITADTACGPFRNFVGSDFWNFYYWMHLFDYNYHFNYGIIVKNPEFLNKFDIVMISGNPAHTEEIFYIAEKCKAITIWFPEGDTCLYHDNREGGIRGDAIKAMNACDIVGIVEEDKKPFWDALLYKPVKFLHTPVPDRLCNGAFYANSSLKSNNLLVYGDNNPNNPLIAFAVAKKLKLPVKVVQINDDIIEFVKHYLGVNVISNEPKMSQVDFLSLFVASSKLIIYPTRWIGTARQVISGAICGTPVIGNRDSHTQQKLFPTLAIYNYDMTKMLELTKRLYDDIDFYEECCKYAFEQVKFYSETNASERMLEAYHSVKKEI